MALRSRSDGETKEFEAAAKRGGFDEILVYVKQSPQPAASVAAITALKTVIVILDCELRDSWS